MNTPAIEAHRGDSASCPENTLAAFEAALRLPVPWIELDVHPSRDGVLMVIHDEAVTRTTGAAGRVSDMTFTELRRLDAGSWFSPRFAGQRIPRLEELFELAGETETSLNIEIKTSPPGVDAPRRIIDLLRRFGREDRYVVSSFDLPALLRVRELAPEVALALIGEAPDILAKAVKNRLPWIHCRHQSLTRAVADEARRKKIGLNVWTVDDPALLPALCALGLDKICTNKPGLIREALKGAADA